MHILLYADSFGYRYSTLTLPFSTLACDCDCMNIASMKFKLLPLGGPQLGRWTSYRQRKKTVLLSLVKRAGISSSPDGTEDAKLYVCGLPDMADGRYVGFWWRGGVWIWLQTELILVQVLYVVEVSSYRQGPWTGLPLPWCTTGAWFRGAGKVDW